MPYFKHTILSIIVSSLSSAYTCEAIYSSNACHVKVTRANQNKTVNIGKSLHMIVVVQVIILWLGKPLF